MKNRFKKFSILSLAVMGVAANTSFVQELPFAKSVVRTIASSIVEETVTAENFEAKVTEFQEQVTAHINFATEFEAKIEGAKGNTSKIQELIANELVEFEELNKVSSAKETKLSTFIEIPENVLNEEVKGKFEASKAEIMDLYGKYIGANLKSLRDEAVAADVVKQEEAISSVKAEIEEQSASIKELKESVCKQKDVLSTISADLKKLLEPAEAVVTDIDALKYKFPFSFSPMNFDLMPTSLMRGQQHDSNNFMAMMLSMQTRNMGGFGGSSNINYAPVYNYGQVQSPRMDFGMRDFSDFEDYSPRRRRNRRSLDHNRLNDHNGYFDFVPSFQRGTGSSDTIDLSSN